MEAERLRRVDNTEGAVTTASDILAAYKLFVFSISPLSRATPIGTLANCAMDLLLTVTPVNRKPDGQPKAETKEAIDFFGRAIAIRPLTAEELGTYSLQLRLYRVSTHWNTCRVFPAAPPPIKKARKAVFKFNEGFSNAVRTTKRVADFLL